MAINVWHVTDDGDSMRHLGSGPGRRRDDSGQWRPIDRTDRGPSPAELLRHWWSLLRDERDGERPLRCLRSDLDDGMAITGREASRVIADSLQGRAFFGVPTRARSPMPSLYRQARKDLSPTDAARRAADLYRDQEWDAGRVVAPTPAEVWRAVKRAQTSPSPVTIEEVWVGGDDGVPILVYCREAQVAPTEPAPAGDQRGDQHAPDSDRLADLGLGVLRPSVVHGSPLCAARSPGK